MPRVTLTDSEASTVANALRVAAAQYELDAALMMQQGRERLRAQFERQKEEARRLMGVFEEAAL